MENNNDRADQDRQQRNCRYGLSSRLRNHICIAPAFILCDDDGPSRRYSHKHVDQEDVQRIHHTDRTHGRYPRGTDHGRIQQAHQNNKSLIHKYRNNNRDNLLIIKRFSCKIFIQQEGRSSLYTGNNCTHRIISSSCIVPRIPLTSHSDALLYHSLEEMKVRCVSLFTHIS